MSKQVLNRPMFAKMKDGSVKPVQYANLGVFIQGGKYALPYLNRFGKYIVPKGGLPYKESASKALTTVKNTLPAVLNKIRSGLPAIKGNIFSSGKVGDKVLKSRTGVGGSPPNVAGLTERGISRNLPALYNPRLYPSVPRSIPGTSSIIPGIDRGTLLSSGASLASLAALDNRNLFTETETETVSPGISDEQRKRDQEDEQRGVPKDDKKDVKNFDDMLKKGDLDSMIQDKIEIFEKYLGKDADKRKKSAGYNAMIEFGLNLATARGGNLVDKISRSAKDPMAKFADVGRKILDRAEQIKMAGVEAGITASEKDADRDVERESIAADKEIQQMKNDATKMDRQQFMLEYSGKLLTDSDALKQVIRPYLDDKGKLPEGTTPQMIVQGTLENVWQSSQPKIITEELIILAQNTPGNEELSREEIIQGFIVNGYSSE